MGNGLLLLIDEADAFVRKRGKDMSEDSRNALNAFLFRTGTPSTDVMVVFASNLPELFDSAVHDRVDEIVQFPLPALEERRKILQEYVKEMLEPMPRTAFWRPAPAPITLDEGVTDDLIVKAADKCEVFGQRAVETRLGLARRGLRDGRARIDALLGRGDAEFTIRPARGPRVVARAVHQAEARARRGFIGGG